MAAVPAGHNGGDVYAWADVDWAAADGTLQVTEFVYDATVVDSGGTGISAHGGWIGEVHYPDTDTQAGHGRPDDEAALTFTYYSDGSVATRTDAEGNTFTYAYDELMRLVETRVTPETYHVGTNPIRRIEYAYTADGMLETATAYDAESGGNVLHETEYTYDDRRNLTGEAQSHAGAVDGNTPVVGYDWEYSPLSAYNFERLTTITYPARPEANGPRGLTFHYGNNTTDLDSALSRVTRIYDDDLADDVAEYVYAGIGRRVATTYGNGVEQTLGGANGYPSLDTWGRLIDLDYTLSSSTVHRYRYGYDLMGNRLFARVTQADEPGPTPHDNDRSYRYGYDGLQRLIAADFGELETDNSAVKDAYANRSAWQLDILGNWSAGSSDDSFTSNVDTDGDGTADDTVTLHHDTLLDNSIDALTANGSGAIGFVHDRSGNLVYDGQNVYFYDAWNRLVAVYEPGDFDIGDFDADGHVDPDPGTDEIGAQVMAFAYDAVGRLMTADDGSIVEHYYYDGVRRIQTIEDDASTPITRGEYVYGPDYVDEFVLQTYRDTGGNQQPWYILQDANYNVVALLNDSGDVLEQYTWEPYGTLADTDTIATPDPDNRIGHQGLFFYSFGSNGLYYNRNRWYSPTLGRFTTKDPNETSELLLARMIMHGGSFVTYVGPLYPNGHYGDGLSLFATRRSNPINMRDAAGLFTFGGVMGAQSLAADMNAQEADMGMSFLDGIRGFADQVSERNLMLDQLMGQAGSTPDFSNLDTALAMYQLYTMVQVTRLSAGVLKAGARFFKRGLSAAMERLRRPRGTICFAAGTRIAAGDGSLIPIESVELGDLVLSEPSELPTLTIDWRENTNTYHAQPQATVEIDSTQENHEVEESHGCIGNNRVVSNDVSINTDCHEEAHSNDPE